LSREILAYTIKPMDKEESILTAASGEAIGGHSITGLEFVQAWLTIGSKRNICG
jgi:hypothetical protein